MHLVSNLYDLPLKSWFLGQLELIKRQSRIFEFGSLVYFNQRVMCNIPGCIDILSNNAITLFTSKCLLFRDYKFAQLHPNYAIISLTKRVWIFQQLSECVSFEERNILRPDSVL